MGFQRMALQGALLGLACSVACAGVRETAAPTGSDAGARPSKASAEADDDAADDVTPDADAADDATGDDTASDDSADDTTSELDPLVVAGGVAPLIVVGDDDGADPADDPAEETSDVEPIVACDEARGSGEEPLIDDFEDNDLSILEVDGRSAGWYDYDDGTLGEAQLLEPAPPELPAVDGEVALHIAGGPYDDYSGVGFGLRWSVTGSETCFYDASAYAGVALWARGSGTVRFTFQTPDIRPLSQGGRCPDDEGCYDAFGFDLELTPDWALYVLPFDEAEQGGWGRVVDFLPEELFTIEFQFAANTVYELWLDDLTFYREGEAPSDTATPSDTAMSSDAAAP